MYVYIYIIYLVYTCLFPHKKRGATTPHAPTCIPEQQAGSIMGGFSVPRVICMCLLNAIDEQSDCRVASANSTRKR